MCRVNNAFRGLTEGDDGLAFRGVTDSRETERVRVEV